MNLYPSRTEEKSLIEADSLSSSTTKAVQGKGVEEVKEVIQEEILEVSPKRHPSEGEAQ